MLNDDCLYCPSEIEADGMLYLALLIDSAHTKNQVCECAVIFRCRLPSYNEFVAFVKSGKRTGIIYAVLADGRLYVGMHAGFGCGSDENLLVIFPARERRAWNEAHWLFVRERTT
jgi:hypothetical protein